MIVDKRPKYIQSGQFDVVPLLGFGLLLTGLATVLSYIWVWVLRVNFDVICLTSVVSGGVIAGLLSYALHGSNCRNRTVAVLLGGWLSTFVMLVTFHIDQCDSWGIGFERIDLLPGYIAFRMETDGFTQAGHFRIRSPRLPGPMMKPWTDSNPTFSTNWIIFFVDFLLLFSIPVVVGWRKAGNPFDETISDWCVCERILLTPASARRLREALDRNNLLEWTEMGCERSQVGQKDAVAADVWYSPLREGRPPSANIFLCIGSKRPIQLAPKEAAALTKLLPEVASLAVSPEELKSDTELEPADSNQAQLSGITGDRVGWVKDPKVVFLSSVLVGASAAMVFYGLAIFWGCRRILAAFNVAETTTYIIMAVIGIAMYLCYKIKLELLDLGEWYAHNVLVRETLGRNDALFLITQEQVLYGEMVPRRNWGDWSRHPADAEIGHILVDDPHARLLFEGDRYRYVIPFAAITECTLEEYLDALDERKKNKSVENITVYVVLKIQVRDGTRELPFRIHYGYNRRNRYEKTVAFHNLLRTRLAL